MNKPQGSQAVNMNDRGQGLDIDEVIKLQVQAWKYLFASLDDSPLALVLFNETLCILAINKSASRLITAIGGNQLSFDSRLLDGFPPESHVQILSAIRPAIHGENSSLSYEFAAKDQLITLGFSFSPLLPGDSGIKTILCTITEDQKSLMDQSVLGNGKADLHSQRLDHDTIVPTLPRIDKHLPEESSIGSGENPLYSQLFNELAEPIFVWVKNQDEEIRLELANQAAEIFTGDRLQDLYGLTLDDFFASSLPFISLIQDTFHSSNPQNHELLYTNRITHEEKWVTVDFKAISENRVMIHLRDITAEKNRQQLDEDTRNQVELLRQAMTAFTSVLNLEQVLKNVLDYLQKLIRHDRVILFLLESTDLHIAATYGFAREEDPLDQRISASNPQFEAINRNRLPLFLTNAKEYRPFETLGDLNCGKSWLGVPLIGHGQLLGYLSIYADEAGRYESEHIRLAEIFANEASIAIENARLFQQVQMLAVTDELSGYYNRRYFYELVDLELARSRRYHHPVSLLMLDIDHFKAVNDRYGHATGDLVLKEICDQVRGAVRESDILGRHGGEEFVIMLPETPLDKAVEVAERLCRMVSARPLQVDNFEIPITISIGVSAVSAACNDADSLFRCADQAMYQAKQAGRNRVSSLPAVSGL